MPKYLILTCPYTNRTKTVAEWAAYLDIHPVSIRARHSINSNDMAYVIYGKKICKLKETFEEEKEEFTDKTVFVFRPDLVVDGEIVSYSAYLPSDLRTPVVTDIIRTNEGWGWDCYTGFEASTRNEVANKVFVHIQLMYA